MFSGIYLGEIARNVITSLIDHSPPLLFNGYSSFAFDAHYGFDAQYMAQIDACTSLEEVKQALLNVPGFEIETVTDNDASIVKWVCGQVGTRGAKLAGCSIAASLIHQGYARLGGGLSAGKDKLVVAAEGK